jgi:hypothetical protein
MRAIAVFVLFIGVVLIMQGYYREVNKCPVPKVEVKYIPMSQYDEVTGNAGEPLKKQFGSMFEDIDPWKKRTV